MGTLQFDTISPEKNNWLLNSSAKNKHRCEGLFLQIFRMNSEI